jgi:ABC-type antimicrobial peptide transport system permease subunit
MALSTKVSAPHATSTPLLTIITLAIWRLRQSWLLLSVTGLGMIAAVMLACTIPIFSQVSTTVGLRGVLNASPESPYIFLTTSSSAITPSIVKYIGQQLTPPVQKSLGQYMSEPPEFSLQSQRMDVISPDLQGNGTYNSMFLYGANTAHAASHVTLVKGRLPFDNSLEIAITPVTAATMKLDVGSQITLRYSLILFQPGKHVVPSATPLLKLRVVGIFNPTSGKDAFWHENDFDVLKQGAFLQFSGLVSNDALIHAFANPHISQQQAQMFFQSPVDLYWYYRLDPLRISSTQLNDLLGKISALQVAIPNRQIALSNILVMDADPPSILGLPVGVYGNASDLQNYRDRVATEQIPVLLLTLQILLLVLFFLVLTAELLVNRQSDAIALLRSRGASRRQIIGALIIQSIALALAVLVVGPLLALVLVRIIMQHILLKQDLNALNTISWSTLFDVRWYALGAAFVAVVTMVVAMYRAANMDVLALRRESSRTTITPFWQRLYLDVAAGIIALTGYGLSQYVVNSQALDPATSVRLSTPLALVAPVFLCIAALLLLLRFFPIILHRSSHLASNGRGAAPMLALAHMARSPLNFVRMTLLLAFTIAFVLFSLVFTASQTQHTYDVAAYQTGADFSGVPTNLTSFTFPVAQVLTAYRHLPGVASASTGHTEEVTTNNNAQSLNVELNAVDAQSFAQTVNWQQWNRQLSMPVLLDQLARRPNTARGIPALVDSTLWNTLHLSVGAPFSLQTAGESESIPFVAMQEILYVPQNSSDTFSGTVVANFANYLKYYKDHFDAHDPSPTLNYVWVRADQHPAAIDKLRSALSSGFLQLSPLYDRVATAQTLQSDALYLNLVGILLIGAITTLLLALLGNWLASWVSVQARQTNFAILRALGTSPGQVASVLVWEQCIVYSMALVLGVLFGLFLIFTVVPVLVFTSVPVTGLGSVLGSNQFYGLQSAIPVRIVFSPFLMLALLAFIVVCTLVVGMMVRVVSKPSLSQMIRLNED